ncbi:heparinase II/III family protein [Martelella endophytica]|nr:heparinase II/III family protein [Martelella endophytica]
MALRPQSTVSFGNANRQLLVAPTDLRAADPLEAENLVSWRFALAGETLDTAGRPPFSMEMPSADFACLLAGFSWLRHLRALRGEEANNFARTVTLNFLRRNGRCKGPAWQNAVAVERLSAWLSHSTVILKGADAAFYRRFVAAILRHEQVLRRRYPTMPHDETRLKAAIALAMASISMDLSDHRKQQAARRLDEALSKQILADGGHIARNPQTLLDLLFQLLPLRQTYINLDIALPRQLVPAIDRIYAALAFFRHRDGNLALFNGAGPVLATTLSALQRYDETGGSGFRALPHTGFQRLDAGGTVLIVDAGNPLSTHLSKAAHAGALSFEMSSGTSRFIVNSGRPLHPDAATIAMARSTPAHSAATIDDASSMRFSRSEFLGPVAAGGIRRVEVERSETDDGDTLLMRHDGYLARFGLMTERRLALSADGRVIAGRDSFRRRRDEMPAATNRHQAIIRFHLHPSIWVMHEDADTIFMTAPDNESWLFSAPGLAPELEEDVFFAASAGMAASRQIVITAPIGEHPDVEWRLERLS